MKPIAHHFNNVLATLETQGRGPSLPPFEDMIEDDDMEDSLFDEEQEAVSVSLSGVNLWRI